MCVACVGAVFSLGFPRCRFNPSKKTRFSFAGFSFG